MSEVWASSGATEGWVTNEAIFDAIFAPITAALLEAAQFAPGQRVLDVGCGTGTLLAAAASAGAVPFGIDISEDMAEAARRRVPQATITVEDAQTADLASRGPYDLVVSRFGVMFFDQPAVAFANIRRAVASSARLVFACWRTIAENPMFSLGTSVLTAQLSPKVDDDPRAPGPAAFADPAYLQDLLVEGGWADHTITPLDVELDYGRDGSDGVEERLAVILSTSTGRLAERQLRAERGADGWSALLGEVRAALRQHVVGDRLRHPAAVWLVQAASA